MLIYTDGAYSPSTNRGGVGFIVLKDGNELFRYSKHFRNTTNNRMELLAVIIALESIKNPNEITIITDSMYLVGTITKGWKRKINLDLWERLDKAINRHSKVIFKWVKGHAGDCWNEQVDKLAVNASQEYYENEKQEEASGN